MSEWLEQFKKACNAGDYNEIILLCRGIPSDTPVKEIISASLYKWQKNAPGDYGEWNLGEGTNTCPLCQKFHTQVIGTAQQPCSDPCSECPIPKGKRCNLPSSPWQRARSGGDKTRLIKTLEKCLEVIEESQSGGGLS